MLRLRDVRFKVNPTLLCLTVFNSGRKIGLGLFCFDCYLRSSLN